MALDRRAEADRPAIRVLTKQEIDRRIQGLIQEVSLLRGSREGAETAADDASRPRWIEPADLVRRLRRFMVYN